MHRLSLLYVGTLPPHPGGSAIVGAQLVAGCAALGHEIRAVAPITAEMLQRDGDRFAVDHPAVALMRFVMPSFESSPNHPPGVEYRRREAAEIGRALTTLLAARRPDVIVIGRETFAWHVPDLARTHGIPTVMLAHGATTTGMLDGSMTPADVRGLVAQFRKVDRIVLVAENLRERYLRLGFGSSDVVQNGVDLVRFAPAPGSPALRARYAIPLDAVVVVHPSNLKDLKRPLDVVAAAAAALRRDRRLVFVVVGDGPMRAAMEDACRAAEIASAFRFTGWVEHAAMPSYLRLADAVVMPSASEALALVYLETMACGRVLIASDIPAAREVVDDGATGLLFRMGDVGDLTERIVTAAADAALRTRIGSAARQAARRHDITGVVARYVELFAATAAASR